MKKMNKEEIKKLAEKFFNEPPYKDNPSFKRDITSPEDVESFYRELNDYNGQLDNSWYIELVESLAGSDASVVATTYSNTIKETIIFDWDVQVNFETIDELIEEILNMNDEAERFATAILVPEEMLKSINNVIEYLYKDEQKNFEESGKPKNHIFRDIKKIEGAFLPLKK